MSKLPHKIVKFEGEALIMLSGSVRITTPEGDILHDVDLKEFPPALCPLFRTMSVVEGESVCITYNINIDLPGIPDDGGKEEAA